MGQLSNELARLRKDLEQRAEAYNDQPIPHEVEAVLRDCRRLGGEYLPYAQDELDSLEESDVQLVSGDGLAYEIVREAADPELLAQWVAEVASRLEKIAQGEAPADVYTQPGREGDNVLNITDRLEGDA